MTLSWAAGALILRRVVVKNKRAEPFGPARKTFQTVIFTSASDTEEAELLDNYVRRPQHRL
jgi:hypothetical protein